MNAEFSTPRLSKIVHEVKEIVIDEKAMISKEECMITVTRDGYIKRVSMRSYNASSDSMTQRKDSIFFGLLWDESYITDFDFLYKSWNIWIYSCLSN